MKYFSMFSGIGGIEIALQELGHECVGYSEIESHAIQIYEKHFKHKNFGDATAINPDSLPDFELLAGGFPCQAFSRSGKRRGYKDSRGTLFFDVCRIAKAKKPRLILLENVAALLDHDGGRTFETMLYSLDELGYDAEWRVLDSWNFGGGTRKRVYIIAVLRNTEITAGERTKQTVPFHSYFAEGIRNKNFINEKDMRNAERIIRIFAKLPDWLDSWDSFYMEKTPIRECGNS